MTRTPPLLPDLVGGHRLDQPAPDTAQTLTLDPVKGLVARISPGNSGGPVINEHGRVVGVSEWKYVGNSAEGLSFAIPASRLCAALTVC